MKTALIYFSLEQNTKEAAEKISKQTGADMYELKMIKSIPTEGSQKFVKGGMQALFGMCPPIEKLSFDENEYDRIIIGTPVWAGKPASPINTFLHSIKNKDQIYAVFTLSGSGDNTKCIKSLKKRCRSIKYTVSLADRNNSSLYNNNTDLTDRFIEKINRDN